MLRHRLSKLGKTSLLALYALLVGGMLNSCQDTFDEYTYDDGDQPSWLGESVYAFLRNNNSGHSYNYYADIIDGLGETETFSKTGSKTVFVADDAAFERFFQNNEWGVRSFSELTLAQKKILLKASMLNDAMLLDMLSASDAQTTSEGSCMRRTTSYGLIDTIPVVTREQTPRYNRFWDTYRGVERDETMLLASGSNNPMLVYFMPDFLKKNGITNDDVSFLFRKNGVQAKTYKTGEAYVYDKKIMASGVENLGFSDDTLTITCKNGYLYRLDDVLLPPSNMAEEVRKRENLSVFSYMLDRFCLPYFDKKLTDENESLTGNKDSVFILRYYAENGGIASNDAVLPEGKRPDALKEMLPYDPSNNQYTKENSNSMYDMAAMLVPTDEAMYNYFTAGSGAVIVGTYAPGVAITDKESLFEALNYVPESLVALFLKNLMQVSFTTTVRSRFDRITDDANDPLEGVDAAVTESIIANNGVIYVLNQVYGPSDYVTVAAPSLLLTNMSIVNKVIEQFGYQSFLKAKKAVYSLFLPDNSAFFYYDPVEIAQARERGGDAEMFEIRFDKKFDGYSVPNQNAEAQKKELLYYVKYPLSLTADGQYIVKYDEGKTYPADPINFEDKYVFFYKNGSGMAMPGAPIESLSFFMWNRMGDLLENLIVVDDIRSGNQYYLTKGGNAIKVDFSDPEHPVFQGGEQIEVGTKVVAKEIFANQINGVSYNTVPYGGDEAISQKLSGIPTPATKSVYRYIYESKDDADKPFHEFLKLAYPNAYNPLSTSEENNGGYIGRVVKNIYGESIAPLDTVSVYSMFYENRGVFCGIPFMQGYNYTVYIPSNEAVQEIIEKGLPTWDDINSCALGNLGGTKEQAAAAMHLLSSFFRYHVQDNSVFVDNIPYRKSYETAYINKNGTFEVLDVNMTGGALTVTDKCGNVANVVVDPLTENKTWNILCREFKFKSQGRDNPFAILASSGAVAHHIDKALCHGELFGYDGMVQRFAPNGAKVEKLYIEGMPGSYYDETDGKSYYLVAAKSGVVVGPNENKYNLAGYLMEPRQDYDCTKLSRERLVKDNQNEDILITEQGYRVTETAEGVFELVYETDDAGNIYVRQYENNGSFNRVLLN